MEGQEVLLSERTPIFGWYLQHARKVVNPGLSFVRRMLELLKRGKKVSDYLHLNKEFRVDVELWHLFLSEWNGVSVL